MTNPLEEFRELHHFYRYHDYLTSEIAKRLGVTPRTIQRWLKGKSKPKERHLELLSQYLDEKRKK